MRKQMRPRIAPGVASDSIEIAAADGLIVGATRFQPAGRPRGTVVVHGATAVPQAYYRRFAAYLAERGLRVVTYDYRGVGRSRPARLAGFGASMTEWARLDAAAIHRFVGERYPGEPLALVGHSFGGQLIGLLDDVRDAAGAYLVACQLPTLDMFAQPWRTLFGFFFRAVVPATTAVAGYVPGWAGLGVDLPAGVAREWAAWCGSPAYLLAAHPDAAERFAAFRRPVVLHSFADDSYAPPRSVEALARALAGADLERRHVSPDDVGAPVGHFGFFRPAAEARFWPGVAAWLEAVLAGERPPRDALITEEELARDLGYRRFTVDG